MTPEERQELSNLRGEVECLKRNHISNANQLVELREWMDTVNSPIWKRLWWWLTGWRFYRLGRWRE